MRKQSSRDKGAPQTEEFLRAFAEKPASNEKFPEAIDAYQNALLHMQPGDFYFSIKKDLAIAFQQNDELGIATRELLEVVNFF